MYTHVADNECRGKGFEEPCSHTRAWLSTQSLVSHCINTPVAQTKQLRMPRPALGIGDMRVGTQQYIQQDAMCLKGGRDRY